MMEVSLLEVILESVYLKVCVFELKGKNGDQPWLCLRVSLLFELAIEIRLMLMFMNNRVIEQCK